VVDFTNVEEYSMEDKRKKITKKDPIGRIPWRDNAFSMATLYSILTAMVGVLLAVIITDIEIKSDWYWPITLLAISFICFVWGTEKLSDALDEDDVDKYLAWFQVYNFGVIMMFFGMATFIYLHYHLQIICSGIFVFLIALIASSKWLKDFYDMIFDTNEKYDRYKEELKGNIEPEKDWDRVVRLHQFIRRILHG